MRNILKLLTVSAAAASVACCAYGGLGLGYNSGYGYSPYGYGSSYYGSGLSYSVGYGSGYGYGSPYYGGYYGSPYFGWYNNYYYPGTGLYVYDSYRRPSVWTDAQRVYWTGRKRAYDSAAAKQGQRTPQVETNWSAFQRDRAQARIDRARTRIDSAQTRVDRARSTVSQTRDTQRQVRTLRVKKRTERVHDRRGGDSDD